MAEQSTNGIAGLSLEDLVLLEAVRAASAVASALRAPAVFIASDADGRSQTACAAAVAVIDAFRAAQAALLRASEAGS